MIFLFSGAFVKNSSIMIRSGEVGTNYKKEAAALRLPLKNILVKRVFVRI